MQNISTFKFTGVPTNQGRTGNIHLAWDTEIPVAVIMTMCIPVEEAMWNIGMNIRRSLIP